jgi:hypothetical protein
MLHFKLSNMEISPAPFSLFSNPLDFFLGKDVFVEVEDLTVYGRIIRYQLGQKERPHRPFILILESPIGKVLIRGNWTAIKQDLKGTWRARVL